MTGHIIPWNYPAQMLGRTLAPALAMGNATVLKPAEETCLSALEFARARRRGRPPGGGDQRCHGDRRGSGRRAVFTSGHRLPYVYRLERGRHAWCSRRRPQRRECVLELGGKSPQIVFADADLDRASRIVVNAIVQNAGQTCSAGSRLLVQREVFDHFVTQLAERFREVQVGSPEMDLDCGPLMNRRSSIG